MVNGFRSFCLDQNFVCTAGNLLESSITAALGNVQKKHQNRAGQSSLLNLDIIINIIPCILVEKLDVKNTDVFSTRIHGIIFIFCKTVNFDF